jgi:parallel beta-helix repeat protein
MVAGGSALGESALQMLLIGTGVESDAQLLGELQRWGRLLLAVRDQPTPHHRQAAVEALLLRGLPEASVLLAVEAVALRPTTALVPPAATIATQLAVSVNSLDLGNLPPGQAARATFQVQGGPGEIVVEADQLQVAPQRFSAGTTSVEVLAQPLAAGVLWTTLKLVTVRETLEVPVLARWDAPVARAAPLQADPIPPAPANPPYSRAQRGSPAAPPPAHEPEAEQISAPAPPAGIRKVTQRGEEYYPTLAAALVALEPGAQIFLPSGRHDLGTGTLLRVPVTLIGQNRETTEIVASKGRYVLRYIANGLSAMQGLTIRWIGTSEANVVVVQSGSVQINDCVFTGGVGKSAVFGARLDLSGQVTGRVSSCSVHGNMYGIAVRENSQPTLENNICDNNQESGIAYFDNAAGMMRLNSCNHNKGFGVRLSGQAHPDIYENKCDTNRWGGIAYFEDTAGTARRNICSANAHSGILVRDNARPLLENNTARANSYDGIAYVDSAGGSATANLCEQNGLTGIYVEHTAQPKLEGNKCSGNGKEDINDKRRRRSRLFG